ncbi:rhamnogalacturonan acetylesterase [Bacillus solitudinis]|uniref:rhamnogalacturonan acetylesterase n=1 Tax=Bacillus solitudinis TaxID=2014074 RepID=UPI000C232B76|nr:rhamnogalacturonan acetylesterase [Bacillus solitudinis]
MLLSDFSFLYGNNNVVIKVDSRYSSEIGYGFLFETAPSEDEDKKDSYPGNYSRLSEPTFVVDLPNGHYQVRITFGCNDKVATTTVVSGAGQRMLKQVRTQAGDKVCQSFAVSITSGRLYLAFLGENSVILQIEVKQVDELPTIYLAGDSTVVDQASSQYPFTGWGQVLPSFLTADILVSNHGRSGRSSKSFIEEGRLEQIWKTIKPNDYLFIQFAHNDEKENEGGTKPFTTYQQYLMEYIEGARERGAKPVLITPMHRRVFNNDENIVNTHGDYPEAMKQVAQYSNTPLIDLAEKSKNLFEELGLEETKKVFMWLEPNEYKNLPEGTKDNTHFSEYGAFEIAKLIVEGIQELPNIRLNNLLRV